MTMASFGQWGGPPLGPQSFPVPAPFERGPVPGVIRPDTQGPVPDLAEPPSIVPEARGDTDHPESDLALRSVVTIADIRAEFGNGDSATGTIDGGYTPPIDLSEPLANPVDEARRLKLLSEADRAAGHGDLWLAEPEYVDAAGLIANAVGTLSAQIEARNAEQATVAYQITQIKAKMLGDAESAVMTQGDEAQLTDAIGLSMLELTAVLRNRGGSVSAEELQGLVASLPRWVQESLGVISDPSGQQG